MTNLKPLYLYTASGALNIWMVRSEGNKVITSWGQVEGKMQTASFDCEPKNVGRSNATTAEEQADKEAQALWSKQLKKKYYLTPDEAIARLNLKPMLAHKWEDHKHKVSYPITVQPKLDGVRCVAYWKRNELVLQSRGGDPYNITHVKDVLKTCLPVGVVLDGELYSHGTSLQTINSLVRRPRYPDTNVIAYCVYDVVCPNQNMVWWDRRNWLDHFLSKANISPYVVWGVPSVSAVSESDVYNIYKTVVEAGYEGVILREHSGEYKFGYRSQQLLKLKEWQDHEFEIIGWTVGKGKFANVPIYRCKTVDGKEFDVTPKGSDAERRQLLVEAPMSIGKLLKVQYFQLTDDGVPQFPVGLGIRDESDLCQTKPKQQL
jgi:DNA ligase-1